VSVPTPTFEDIIVFTDGACSGNPGRGGWGTIIVLPEGEVEELGGKAEETTNNRMELMAAIVGLERLAKIPGKVSVYTDSVYVIKGITQWIWGWRQRGWKNSLGEDVANQDLWEQLSRAVGRRASEDRISWHYVRGHIGVPGNERVDEIAVSFSKGKSVSLYRGPLLRYGIAIHDIPEDTSLPEPKKDIPKKIAAYSYVSLVDGIARRHKTWPDCERLVKGRSGAKFKKTTSAENEQEILVSWGVDPNDVQDS
jgi:ribonuclease HI